MAKRFAEAQQKSNVAERLNSSEELRRSIGLVRGAEGADLVHATAIAEERKQFGEFVTARQEIMKHFKVSSQEIAKLSMGEDVTKERDGHTVTFRSSDKYTHEAAIDKIFQVGAYSDIIKVVESTGVGGVNYDYRATVLDSLQKNGRSKAAPFLNDKAFDIILNGQYDGESMTRRQVVRRIAEGRLTDADLAGAHANAIEMFFNAASTTDTNWITARTEFLDAITDPVKRAEAEYGFNANFSSVRQSAVEVLRDPQIRQTTSRESINAIKRFLGIPPDARLDNFDWDSL